MKATPPDVTLPQLLERYRAEIVGVRDRELGDLILHTYHSTAIEGSSLTLSQTQTLIQTGLPVPGKPLTDQWMMMDHHQAIQQILTLASQREPLNPTALQQVAATLMRQTGGPIHSLLSSFDTSKGELRIDSAMAGRRVLVTAHKLPAALAGLLKEINTCITQLKTPRQVYDLSFRAHYQLLTLHPFGAGNGPTARLLSSYIQHYHQLPLSLVYAESRAAYLASLEASWRQKTPMPIVSFMHSQLRHFLQEQIDQPCAVKQIEGR